MVNDVGGRIISVILIAWILDEDHIHHARSTKQTVPQVKGWKPEQLGATKGKCQNCGKKGNYIVDFWEKGGGKEGQAPKWWNLKTESNDKDSMKQIEDADFAFLVDDRALISMSASNWLVDSAITTHIVQERKHFVTYTADPSEIEGIIPVTSLKTHGYGTVAVEFKVKKKKIYSFSLHDVKHAPKAPNSLLSIGHLMDNGKFMPASVEFKSKTGITFGVGQNIGHMYQMCAWEKSQGWDLWL